MPIERAGAKGVFIFVCLDRFGNLRWTNLFENMVVNQGKNLMLDTFFGGSAYTSPGAYLGLISSVGYTAIAATDTQASHPGWVEAGGANAPTYTAPRPTLPFNAAVGGVKTLSNFVSYSMTGGGTIKGGFVVSGPGAVNTIDNTAGTLWSAGLFIGGDNVCHPTDIVYVGYTTSL